MKKSLRVIIYSFALLCISALLVALAGSFLVVSKSLDRSDAILILSGSSEYKARVDTAADLFHRGVSSKILLTNDGERSGWDDEHQTNPLFTERARRRLIDRGVPNGAIEILPGTVINTNQEAELFAGVAAERQLKSLVLVTSDYHTRRAIGSFERSAERAGVSVEFGVEYPREPEGTSKLVWSNIGTVMLEYLKLGYYRWEH